MSEKQVLFLDTVHPLVMKTLKEKGFDCIPCWEMEESEIVKILPEAIGIVLRSRIRMDQGFLEKAKNLKWIARSGVGMENIDEAYCASRGIQAFNAVGGNADAVGEHVIGMLLALFNKIKSGDKAVREGNWDRESHRGIELGHRKLGIIGFGHTGKSLAKKLKGFGTDIRAYDPYAPVKMEGVKPASLEQIQAHCDVISFHVPLTEETHHYLSKEFIELMASPFYLVNASRGPVASTEAIAYGIEKGKILGACMDVLEEEDHSLNLRPEKNPALQTLLKSDKTLFSPHVAGWSIESYENLARVLLKRIFEVEGI